MVKRDGEASSCYEFGIENRGDQMNAKVRLLIDEARKLSPDEQSELVDALVEGLPATDWYNQEDLAEWQRRADEARANPAATEDADKVMADLRAELKAMRR